ncbi:AMP-binding protein [Alteromonas gracilis]|uniref:Carrier domain-containing protein n=1 Tax=Alteromonas gracilis TaxID=1479524 RepID=A0ABX5CSC0_9ALTE|nr:AMP-binding protein [Alteromonas gracilis]PRO69888.1 hypothetical protein C6Y39_05455 [Alteromonas gracilis]
MLYESLNHILTRLSSEKPDIPAYIFLNEQGLEQEIVTYYALHSRVKQAAEYLTRYGYAGSRAILVYPQGIEFVVTFLACLKAGVVAIPVPGLDATLKARLLSRVMNIVKDADVSLILTTPATREACAPSLNNFAEKISWVTIPQGFQTDYDKCFFENRSSSVAYLQYTSGSTSLPKGVVISHGTLIKHLETIQDSCAYNPQSISATWMPHFHDYGLVEGLLLPLFNGTLCVFMSPSTFIKRPALWFQTVSRYKATHSHAPSFAHELCIKKIKEAELSGVDLSSWQVAALGAEPIKPYVLLKFFETFSRYGFSDTALSPAYGLAENTLVATVKKPFTKPKTLSVCSQALKNNTVKIMQSSADNGVKDIVSCGLPVKNTSVIVVDPDKKTRRKNNEVGEVWITSEGVASGYWNNAGATIQTFMAKLEEHQSDSRHFLRTGDLGFVHEGELYITGRLKDLIIIDGVNYWPQDIEWAVENCHSSIKQGGGCVAFSIDVFDKERLVLVCEVKSDGVDCSELYRCCAESVFEVCGLILYDFVVVSKGTILKTSSGKLQRGACRDDYRDKKLNFMWSKQTVLEGCSGKKDIGAKINSLNTAQKGIVAWLTNSIMQCSQLITSAPHAADVFSELPLDSLDYLTLSCDIESRYNIQLALSEFVVNRRTIEDLAEQICARLQGQDPENSSLILLQKTGEGSPFFFVHPAGGNVIGYVSLANCFAGERPFYGIQSQGLVKGTSTLRTFEEMAEFYIQEMKRVQPNGPYFIGGMCLGGIIAYEMAQQIQRSGESVAFLGLVDPRSPSLLLKEIENASYQATRKPTPFSSEHLAKVKILKQESEKTESPKPPRDIVPSDPQMKKVWDNNARAREEYKAVEYEGDVSFFWADKTQGTLGFQHNPEVCWSLLVNGNFKVHHLGFNHFQMLEKPFVDKLGLSLLAEIDKADT